MTFDADPQWRQIALYAVGGAVLLFLLFKVPIIGPAIRGAFSLALLAIGLFVLLQQAPYDPTLSRLTDRLGIDDQQIDGDEVRISKSTDGHFWAEVALNGQEHRMLIDTGATITALSLRSAQRAGVDRNTSLIPVVVRTANGIVTAQTGAIDSLRLEVIEARNLKVIISPAFGAVDVLGMNFLSQLAFWRVEGRTLILTPNASKRASEPPQPLDRAAG